MVFAVQCVHCTAVCSVYYIAHCTSSPLIVCNMCVWLPDNCYTIKLTCDPVMTVNVEVRVEVEVRLCVMCIFVCDLETQ